MIHSPPFDADSRPAVYGDARLTRSVAVLILSRLPSGPGSYPTLIPWRPLTKIRSATTAPQMIGQTSDSSQLSCANVLERKELVCSYNR